MKSRVALISLATIAFATQATVKTMTDEDDDDDKKIIKVEPENNHKEQQELQEQQNNTLPPPPIVPDIPTSPQAQAFSRLGDYGMNNSSGVPNISIPLFEIDHFGYTIPLTLCYEAQPLRPGYNYDVFGLGWSLSGNSCVSRTIHDRADEDGLFGTPFKLDSFSEHNGNPKLYKNWADKLGEVNYEYDSYNITLPSGRNIPFFMYMEGTQMKYDLMDLDSNVKIVCHYSTSLCSIDSFDVTDEDGTVYTFDIAEKASNIYLDDINAVRNVSWLLSRIDIPHKQCSLIYEYGNLIQFSAYTAMEPILTIDRMYTDVVEDDPEQKYRFYFNMQDQCCIYNMRFLQKITYGPTEVVFDYQSDGRHISTIRVNDNNSTVKKYTFALSGQYAKLSTLTITGTNTVDQQKYKFEYASINPGTKIDPWGNYGTSSANTDIGNINLFVDKGGVNVQDMTSYLSPLGNMIQRISPKPTDLQCYYKLKLQSQTSGDSRQATSPSQHGVLTRIVYPNGGSTAYTFENHRFLTATDANGDFVFARRQQRIIEGGGFRIKSIKNYKADGSLANQAEYRYGYTYGRIAQTGFPLPLPASYNSDAHIGCGEPVVDPNLLTYLNYDYSRSTIPNGFVQMLLGIHVSGYPTFENYSVSHGGTWWWETRLSALNFRKLLGGRRAVVYPEITVYHGNPDAANACIGKTVYEYDIYAYDIGSGSHYRTCFGQTVLPDTAYFELIRYPNSISGSTLVCEEIPARRDRLSEKSEYGRMAVYAGITAWMRNQKETYEYEDHSLLKNGWLYSSIISRGHCGLHSLAMGEGRNDDYINLQEFYTPSRHAFGRSLMTKKKLTRYFYPNDSLSTTESYAYTIGGALSFKTYWDEFNKKDTQTYVGDCNETSTAINELIASNMLTSLVTTTSDVLFNGQYMPVAGYKIVYGSTNDGHALKPWKLYERNGSNYEESVEILSYDGNGHPSEIVDKKTGVHTVFRWRYNGRYLTDKVVNATGAQVGAALDGSGNIVRSSLPDAMIETWEYEPLIGVTSYTDVSGKTTIYEYDGLGRLKKEKQRVGNNTVTLREYTYQLVN